MSLHVAKRRIAAAHPASDGHFPGNPIIPGAVLLDEIVAAVASSGSAVVRLDIRVAKFFSPVRPGESLHIEWEEKAGGEIRFACSAGSPRRRVATGVLRLGAAT